MKTLIILLMHSNTHIYIYISVKLPEHLVEHHSLRGIVHQFGDRSRLWGRKTGLFRGRDDQKQEEHLCIQVNKNRRQKNSVFSSCIRPPCTWVYSPDPPQASSGSACEHSQNLNLRSSKFISILDYLNCCLLDANRIYK